MKGFTVVPIEIETDGRIIGNIINEQGKQRESKKINKLAILSNSMRECTAVSSLKAVSRFVLCVLKVCQSVCLIWRRIGHREHWRGANRHKCY